MASQLCPECGNATKRVGAITLRSLLTHGGLEVAGDGENFRHCPAQQCNVAYFHSESGRQIEKAMVQVRIGTKETDSPRPVCYCFDHSWESIEADFRQSGKTTALETITAHCRAGEHRCPETNPQGSCCLGNVRRVIKETETTLGVIGEEVADSESCCASDDVSSPKRSRFKNVTGSLFAAGGLTAAILSSACCWLPLLLIGLGFGTTSVAGFFENYRIYFLMATATTLGAGFYFIYFKQEKCAPGSECAVPNPGVRRFNRIALWIATAGALAFALFPNYVGLPSSTSEEESKSMVTSGAPWISRSFSIEGMTCEGCASHLREDLGHLAGVEKVAVSYPDKRAVVSGSEAGLPSAQAVIDVIENAGYRATAAGSGREKSGENDGK